MINREIVYERNLTGSFMKIAAVIHEGLDEKLMLRRKLQGLLAVEIIFTVNPGGSGTIGTEFQQLMEFLLTKVDHKDTRAVKAAYGIYEKTLLDGYSITDIRDEIVRTRQNEGKKAAVEESGGNGMEKVWREENNQPVVPERKYEDHPDKKRKDKQRK